MNYLNSLEFAIIQDVLKSNILKKTLTQDLLKHLLYIRVKERKLSQVGMYIHFEYIKNFNFEIDKNINLSLSSDNTVKFNNFDDLFSFELNFNNGLFNYIELVTYSNNWSGKYDSFIIK